MSARWERKGQRAHETVVDGWVPETEEVLFCCLITEVASYTHAQFIVWVVPMHKSGETSSAVVSSDLAPVCFFSNGILLWKDIFFPTLWTLSTDSIHLADSLQ